MLKFIKGIFIAIIGCSLFMFIGVQAEELIATCYYDAPLKSGEMNSFEVEIYTDSKKAEFPLNDWVGTDMFVFGVDEKEFYKQVYDGNKVSATCPKLSVCDISNGYEVQENNRNCAIDGRPGIIIEGTMENSGLIEEKEDLSRDVCTKYITSRYFSPQRIVKFFYNSDGEKAYSVYRNDDSGIGGQGLFDQPVVVETIRFTIHENLYELLWKDTDTCKSTPIYLEMYSGTRDHLVLTNKEPSPEVNGGVDNPTGSEENENVADSPKIEFTPNKLCKDSENCNIDLTGFCAMPTVTRTLKFIGLIFSIIKILVPAIIIILGIVDLVKIITSGKTEEVNKSVKVIVTRILIGVVIFLLPGIINFFFDIADSIINSNGNSKFKNCYSCILTPDDKENCMVTEYVGKANK